MCRLNVSSLLIATEDQMFARPNMAKQRMIVPRGNRYKEKSNGHRTGPCGTPNT